MKKLLRSLLLAAVLTTVLCVGALAADGDPKSGVYNIAPAAGTTFTPLEVSSSSATINGTQVDHFYAEAAKFSLNVENLQAGEQYLLLIVKNGTNGALTGDSIYYIAQAAATDGKVAFTAYPKTMSSGSYTVYLTGGGRTISSGAKVGSFDYYQAYTLGDVNGDGGITTTDALLILQHIVHKIDLTETQQLAADVSKANGVDTTDALMILQYIVHKITEF